MSNSCDKIKLTQKEYVFILKFKKLSPEKQKRIHDKIDELTNKEPKNPPQANKA